MLCLSWAGNVRDLGRITLHVSGAIHLDLRQITHVPIAALFVSVGARGGNTPQLLKRKCGTIREPANQAFAGHSGTFLLHMYPFDYAKIVCTRNASLSLPNGGLLRHFIIHHEHHRRL